MESVRMRFGVPETGPTGANVRIAVLDTGYDSEHPDLQRSIDTAASRTFVIGGRDCTDRYYHGTHIAGVIAGSGTVEPKYRGMAPDASLLIYKVAEDEKMSEGAVADAIGAAIDEKVDIINYSAGHSPAKTKGAPPWIWASRSAIEEMFAQANAAGILCVAAAGNDGLYYNARRTSSINRPSGAEEVLCVGAIDHDDRLWNQSSNGPYLYSPSLRHGAVERFDAATHKDVQKRAKPDVVAPGVSIVAPRSRHSRCGDILDKLTPQGMNASYVPISGSSQATATMSGLAACLIEEIRRRNIPGPCTPMMLRSILKRSARRLGSRNDFGAGIPEWASILEVLQDCENNPGILGFVQSGEGIKRLD